MATPNRVPFFAKQFPDRQNDFEAVLLEGDTDKLSPLLETAEAAIFLRLQTLTFTSDEYVERNAITDALRTLRAFKSQNTSFSEISSPPGFKTASRKNITESRSDAHASSLSAWSKRLPALQKR